MFKHRLVSNFDNILRAKIYFFFRKSIWKYLVLSIILGFLKPMASLGSMVTALLYFGLIMIILWPLQYLSAKALSKSIDFDASVEFHENEIRINHLNKDGVETKDWSWIKEVKSNKERIWLTINHASPFAMSIPKSKMQGSEIEFFERKMKSKNNK